MNLYSNINPDVPYQGLTGLGPIGLPNPYLEWEETKKLQIGFDFGFLTDKILVGATYVRNRSSNQLLTYSLPNITGFSGIIQNFPATIQNTAWEFSLNTKNLSNKTFNWLTSVNFTLPENKVVSFPSIESTPYASGNLGVIIGQPLGVKKVFDFLGVDPSSGLYQFADGKGGVTERPDTAINNIAQTSLVSTIPKFYGGIQNSVTYKAFRLDFLFQFVKQLGPNVFFYNGNNLFPGSFSRGASNQPATVLGRWQKIGDDATIHKFSTMPDNSLYNAVASDFYYSDASFIRLKNVSLSWQMPEDWRLKMKLQSFRLYMQGQNLITITSYRGMDPENQSTSSLPPLRIWTLGLQMGL